MTKIDRIKQACRLAIELGKQHAVWIQTEGAPNVIKDQLLFTPAAARALLASIDMFELIIKPWPGCDETDENEEQETAHSALTAIEASFTDLP